MSSVDKDLQILPSKYCFVLALNWVTATPVGGKKILPLTKIQKWALIIERLTTPVLELQLFLLFSLYRYNLPMVIFYRSRVSLTSYQPMEFSPLISMIESQFWLIGIRLHLFILITFRILILKKYISRLWRETSKHYFTNLSVILLIE